MLKSLFIGTLYQIVSPEIDLTATVTGLQLGQTFPGRFFVPYISLFQQTAVGGAVTTVPHLNAGNNVAKNNITAASTTNPTAAQFALGVPSINNFTIAAKPVNMVDMTNPILLDITAAATGTGGFVWKGKIIYIGILL